MLGLTLTLIKHFSREDTDPRGMPWAIKLIAAAFGGKVISAKRLMHGKTSMIYSDGKMLYQGIRSPLWSNAVSLTGCFKRKISPECLEISSETEDGEIMGIRHVKHPTEGIQFHPESIMSTQWANGFLGIFSIILKPNPDKPEPKKIGFIFTTKITKKKKNKIYNPRALCVFCGAINFFFCHKKAQNLVTSQ